MLVEHCVKKMFVYYVRCVNVIIYAILCDTAKCLCVRKFAHDEYIVQNFLFLRICVFIL